MRSHSVSWLLAASFSWMVVGSRIGKPVSSAVDRESHQRVAQKVMPVGPYGGPYRIETGADVASMA
jgi:hypothetical protein